MKDVAARLVLVAASLVAPAAAAAPATDQQIDQLMEVMRVEQTLEVAVLWSRSSAVGWQHVFRATDEINHIRNTIREGLRAVTSGSSPTEPRS